jgi:disulfide bond formation protein DsbB
MALVLAGATILGALGFEHIGGYLPCPLCLQQRYAYYAGIPLLFLALVLLSAGWRRPAALVFFVVSLAFLANAGLGAYHAGAEWHFWPGPDTCAGAQELTTSAGGLLEALPTTNVIRCDEAAVRFAGISLAGWNVIVSLLAAALSLSAGVRSARLQ